MDCDTTMNTPPPQSKRRSDRRMIGGFPVSSKTMAAWWTVRLLLLGGAPSCQHVTASTTTTEALFRNLGPSMMASMSQGTTIAVPCWIQQQLLQQQDDAMDDSSLSSASRSADSVLILIRTPAAAAAASKQTSVSCNDHDENKEWDSMGDLHVHRCNVLSSLSTPSTTATSQPRWQILTPNIVVCFTGFSPEVHLLSRFLQVQVDAMHQILSDETVVRTPPAVQLMQNLALPMAQAALQSSSSGRPFGVAVLMVGRSSNNKRWQLWTLDPTGTLNSHAAAAVIGKQSPVIQRELLLFRNKKNEKNEDNGSNDAQSETTKQDFMITPRRALIRMLRACVESSDTDAMRDGYEAILLSWQDGSMQVGQVAATEIQDCIQSIVDGGKQ